MSPQVFARKLSLLQDYLSDLRAYVDARSVHENHYAVERLIQLLVEVMFDLMEHWLVSQGFVGPDRYQEVIRMSAEHGLISAPLAESLASASKMRNLLVHAYERIDPVRLEQALPVVIRDVQEFIRQVSVRLGGGDRP